MEILGVKIDNLTRKEALLKLEDFLKSGKQHYIVTPNPEFLVRASKDEKFKSILNKADLSLPDGVGLIFVSYYSKNPLKERITGVDFMERACLKAAKKKWLVFLFGGREGADYKTAQVLRNKYPGLQIDQMSFEKLQKEYFLPAILFVALGAPKQEKWIVENLHKMPSVRVAVGVGGAFDFFSGKLYRAPKILRKTGLEWSWRLMLEPKRIKRAYNAVVKFPYLVIKSK